MSRRIVISGLGVVSPFGFGAPAFWEGLVAGRAAFAPITLFDASSFPSRLAAEVRDFSVKDHVPKSYRKAIKVMARDTEMAVGAAKAAVEDARLVTKATIGDVPEGTDISSKLTYRPERVGCQIGAGLIAAEVPELSMALAASTEPAGVFSFEKWGAGGMENLTPLWLLKYLPNMLACHVTILHDAQGPSNTITCAEASGLLSIGESMRVIERGDAEICFSGSAESKINAMGVTRLDFANRLAHHDSNTDPAEITRPYDPESPGSLVGEGGAILMLEDFDSALSRGATPYCELIGFGAGHSPMLGNPDTRSEGLRAAIENALEDASLTPADIDAIVPHATGVPDLDAEELSAFRAIFGNRLSSIECITFTPNIGETMAGHGSLAAAAAALALRHQQLPARVNAGRPPSDLRAEAAQAHPAKLRHILVCTHALGGQNAALIMKAI